VKKRWEEQTEEERQEDLKTQERGWVLDGIRQARWRCRKSNKDKPEAQRELVALTKATSLLVKKGREGLNFDGAEEALDRFWEHTSNFDKKKDRESWLLAAVVVLAEALEEERNDKEGR
jgi:hypothetical protein